MDSGQPDPGTNPAGNPLLEMAGHGAAAIPTSAPIASSPVYISSPMVKPAPFSGREEDCSGFLLQCSLALEVQPYQFPTERSKISFIISLLSGRALQWAETLWNRTGPVTDSLQNFITHFKEVFGFAIGDSSVGEQLYHLQQGQMSVTDYALKFRTLAVASGWDERALITTYRQGLNPALRLHLAIYDDVMGVEKFIQQSIRVSRRVQNCYPDRHQSSYAFSSRPAENPDFRGVEPMQVDQTRLSPSERTRRMTNNLCLYCGDNTHYIGVCPVRPPRLLVSSMTISPLHVAPLSTIVSLISADVIISVTALIDSGSEGNFISGDLCRQLQLPKTLSPTPFTAKSVTGKALNPGYVKHRIKPITLRVGCLHEEPFTPLVLENSTSAIILGRPWLIQHNPEVSWKNGDILRWGSTCFSTCFPKLPRPVPPSPKVIPIAMTSIESPKEKQSTAIPSCYASFADVFSPEKASHLPPHRPWDCAIDLEPGKTVPRSHVYSLSIPEQRAMEEYIQEALNQGYIRPSVSPAASSFFFVAKKDGGLRPCIDYRALNKITIKFRYPLPLVPTSLEQLRGASIFTKLDLRSAYNLIRIRDGDEWKTAFITPSGHYEYLVMPYGLVNAPSVFQDFMNEVLRDFLNQFVIVYIDDILIFSQDKSAHRRHVSKVLQRLRDHSLFLKAEKCFFHQESVAFLGYVVSKQGVQMDDGKVTAITSWPTPQTVKELQRFLGFANFYRRFINNYSTITSSLTSLLKGKPKSLSWDPDADHAFQTLKNKFITAPLLHHPNPDLAFIVEVDASTTGVGAILSQHQENAHKPLPCAFFSKKLSPAEQNYDVGNRELLAIKLALEEWRHWLEGAQHPFMVLTDHKNLQYLKEAKRLNPRQARWALFFTRFHFHFTYCPGTKNIRADALSRLHAVPGTVDEPETVLPTEVFVNPIQWDIDDQIQEATRQEPTPPGCPDNLTYVPNDHRLPLIESAHSSVGTGHPGATQTYTLLQQRYWWPGMREQV